MHFGYIAEKNQFTFVHIKIHDTDATNRQYYLQEMLLGQNIRISVKSNLKYDHIIWKLAFKRKARK